MKRLLLLLGLIAFIILSVSAATMTQKLYDATDIQYIKTVLLCQSMGVVGPSTALPVTGEELHLALSRIDKNNLSEKQREIYDRLYSSLEASSGVKFDIFGDISPQVFITDRYEGNFSREDFYALKYKDERPGIEVGAAVSFGENIVLEGSLPFINVALKNDGVFLTSLDWLINFRNNQFNFMGGKDKSTMNRDQIPDEARGSFGNKYFNFSFGRMKHSMGSGFTGNLTVGDNYRYQEVAKLSFISNWFTYNISMTHFDQQIGKDRFQYTAFGGMHQNRVIHRFDVNVANKVRVALNLGTLYQTDSAFDFRFFVPFIISHHFYNYKESTDLDNKPDSDVVDEANNVMSIEVEIAPIKNLKITLQGILDQFQLPKENQTSLPMAAGALLNTSYLIGGDKHSVLVWGEGVYTTPYLYLNFKNDANGPNYNYDYILGYNRRDNWNWQLSDISYSGYPSGPDTIAFAIGADYTNYEIALKLSGYLKYQIHGEQGFKTDSFEGSIGKTTPTGIPERMYIAHLDFSWQALPSLEVFGGTQLTHIANFNNIEGEKITKVQGYLGFTWRYALCIK